MNVVHWSMFPKKETLNERKSMFKYPFIFTSVLQAENFTTIILIVETVSLLIFPPFPFGFFNLCGNMISNNSKAEDDQYDMRSI